jgi:hypothetical protein
MNLLQVLKTTLESDTGVSCYGLEKPPTAPLPAIVITLVAENQLITHSGDRDFRTARVQLTLIASSIAGIVTLVEDVRDSLNANKTDFNVSLPLETRIDNKEDDLLYSILEYRINYNS